MKFAVKGRDKYRPTRLSVTKVSIILEMAREGEHYFAHGNGKTVKKNRACFVFFLRIISAGLADLRGGRVNGDAIPVVKNGTGAGCKKKGKKRKETREDRKETRQEKRGKEMREGKRGKETRKGRESKKKRRGKAKRNEKKRFVSFCVSLGYSYLCRQDEAVYRFVYRL